VQRSHSTSAHLARLGFAEPGRSAGLLAERVLSELVGEAGADDLAEPLSRGADPDLAVLGLIRLVEATQARPAARDGLADLLQSDDERRHRLLVTLGGSRALVDHLATHPEHWRAAADATPPTAADLRSAMTDAVRAHYRSPRQTPSGMPSRSYPPAYDVLRVEYRRQLLRIAALDLATSDPVTHLPVAAEALAQLAEATLEAALLISREEFGPGHEDCRLAIIGMGKTGGGELNYISDVDVIFVVEPADGATEERAVEVGTVLAAATMKACGSSTAEGTLWPVDAALRPEGKQGPLVRTIASHKAYYERWAKTWEFQALLKAWVSAGDLELGKAYKETLKPLIWGAAGRDNFVEDVQAMRRRVEQHVPAAEAARQLKLGPGGLRDVEFSVQLLQLVHGRTDESLRSATTLEALHALARGGYVARDDAATLDRAYRLLRTLEHRIQLYRLRRTHLMPTEPDALRILGRALGLEGDPAAAVVAAWQSQAREVRRIHERLFYRPLLAAAARLSSAETSLSPEQARARFAALGFRDPAGAMRHVEALTSGVSRRAAIQRTLLPVMLGWFADEADPDAGLLAFRRVSDELGTIHWYLKMLRDEGSAAERLAHVLGRSRYAAELLIRAPESVAMFGEPDGLVPRTEAALTQTFRSAAGRRDSPMRAMASVGALRRQEILRVTLADLLGDIDVTQVGRALSDIAAATIAAALDIAGAAVTSAQGGAVVDMLVVGMGSLGGAELGYGSDADVIIVHRPHEGIAEDVAQRQAIAIVQELVRLVAATGPDPLVLDIDLRPEGKNGPLSRSLTSYAAYYDRWALTWEFQALLRARPIAGDAEVATAYLALIDPLRWRPGGLTATQLREVRTMKARVEAERLPRGADPRTHLKLGRGGLTDIEWTVQALQLQHADTHPELRTPNTVAGLGAAAQLGLVTAEQAETLLAAWTQAARLRNAVLLWKGRPGDAVPGDVREADGVGRIVGREPGTGATLTEAYLRQARRGRAVVDTVFYGHE
jgi:glutamate-ammonia-ligase adenylyltransferase